MTTLSDAERAALWPAVTDEISDLEMLALEREWKRRKRAYEVALVAAGVVIGVAVAALAAVAWLFF